MINKKHIDNLLELKNIYKENIPYPHIVIDDFLETDYANELLKSHQKYFTSSNGKLSYDTIDAIKLATDGEKNISEEGKKIIRYLNSEEVLEFINSIASIHEPLIPDPYLIGGGFHYIQNGGYLNVHVDFNKHPKLKLDRRINIILYLNKNWKENYNGDLELWAKDNSKKVTSVFPHFNRAVIFSTTDFSWHGHPKELLAPSDCPRRSLALYYYSNGRPDSEINSKISGKSTTFVRPKNRDINLKQKLIEFTRRIVK